MPHRVAVSEHVGGPLAGKQLAQELGGLEFLDATITTALGHVNGTVASKHVVVSLHGTRAEVFE